MQFYSFLLIHDGIQIELSENKRKWVAKKPVKNKSYWRSWGDIHGVREEESLKVEIKQSSFDVIKSSYVNIMYPWLELFCDEYPAFWEFSTQKHPYVSVLQNDLKIMTMIEMLNWTGTIYQTAIRKQGVQGKIITYTVKNILSILQ